MNVALIILNKDYSCARGYSNLPGVTKDGVVMKEMLSHYEVKIVENATKKDIEQALKQILDNQRNIETLHFHFSGHGVDNCTLEMNVTLDAAGCKKYEAVSPTGDCMVGVSGELYPVLELKHELLACNPARLIVTLDCCRNSAGRGGGPTVKLRHREKISIPDLMKIAVIQGTCELHTARDAQSFTQQLYEVVKKEGGEIPILEIASKVNKSWFDQNIRTQCCKDDILRVEGDSWTDFMWPGPTGEEKLKRDLKKLREADEQMSDVDFYNFLLDTFPGKHGLKKREIITPDTTWAAYHQLWEIITLDTMKDAYLKLCRYHPPTQEDIDKYGEQYRALCKEIWDRGWSRYEKMLR
eukprot:GFUD01016420.1.p1 GENE.GFUD01016420.1~~GFUD01016420.1.p1  ORF type:complete len:354 (-),score=72.01 GFUD01016420.1:6-1067(-)